LNYAAIRDGALQFSEQTPHPISLLKAGECFLVVVVR